MATPKSWADITNADIALIRQARGLPLPANFNQTSPFANLTKDDAEFVARMRGREYNPKFSANNNLRGDDIDFLRQMRPQGTTAPQQFANSGTPYVGGALSSQPQAVAQEQGVLNAVPIVFGSGQVTPETPNKSLMDRMNGSRRQGPMAGVDPALPSTQSQGPVDYATLNSTSESGVYPFTAGVASTAPVPEQQGALKIFQNKVRSAMGLPPLSDTQGVLSSVPVGPPSASAALPPQQPLTMQPDPVVPVDTRGMENGYGIAPAALDTRTMENGIGALMPKANAPARSSGGSSFPTNVPLPPDRPANTSPAALYYLDDGSGALRPFLSRDGSMPNIPGVTAIKDDTFNPDAGALAKFIRGVF